MQRFLFIFITFFLYLQSLTGKEIQYSYAQLSINEGLTQANVESILLDQRGGLWIGTRNGLNHYARQKMDHFFHQMGNKNSLPNSRIIHLEEDSLGNIWVATNNGLTLYDREDKNFRTLTRGQVNSSLCINGGVLFGGENVLYFYNYQTQDLERILIHPEAPDVIPIEYRVEKILPFKENKLLLGTRKKGLFTFDCSTHEVKPFSEDIPNLMLFSFCLASDESIYIAYYGNGVYRFNQQGEKIEFYMTGNSPITNNYAMDVLEHDGKLWIATDGGGINQIDLTTRKFSVLTHITGDKTSLPVNSITKLYKDYNGTLWAGSVRGGVFTIKESYIKTYQDVVMGNSSGLTEKSVTSIYEEKDGTLWIGTDGGGINRYNPITNQFTHYPDTYGDKVVSIANLSEDELLLSLYTKGIFTFNKRIGQYRPFIVVDKETNQKECFYGYLPLLSQIGKEKIYIISFGAWVYHIPTKQFTPLLLPEQYRKSTAALKLAFTHKEFSLLQQENRAFIVNPQNDSVRLLFEADANENIHTMTYDADNRTIWIGTNHGLSFYHMDKMEYKHFTTSLFNSVSYLTLDQEKRLWICADNKLFTYYMNEDKFSSWSKTDGYLPNEIKPEYQTTLNKDYIYLSGSQGLVRINNSIHPAQEEHPEIYLADIMYDGKSSIKQMQNGGFEIPWDYHSIELTIGLKSKDVFQKHLIKYIIKGVSGENIHESYETQLNLSSLSPGTYTLLASCYTKDGNEIAPVQLLTLTVTPPWYKNTWFICLMMMLFIGGTIGIGRWIYQKKTRQMKGDVGEFLQTVLHSLNKKDELPEETGTSEAMKQEETESEIKKPVLSDTDRAFLEKMDKLIYENLSNDELSAKFLTDHLAMSRASLYNKVKTLTGMGVNDYINRIRIERSVHLLTHTDMSINDISYEVGFSYPRYFSTSFKQVKGMTPTRFKEESKKNITLLLLITIPFLAICTSCHNKNGYISDKPLVSNPIVVIYENDVHCAVDGYAKLATVREQQKALTPYVTTVSCGDFIQGDVVGAISTGGHIIDIMNLVDYDFVTLGNHEFDFGIPRMFELMEELKAQVLNANFRQIQTDIPVFPAYEIVSYENVDIAYIGLTTTTLFSSSPKKFQNESGAFIYDFSKNTFYETAQRYINQARQEGADYVVVLSHLGEEVEGDHPNSHSLIAQTTGIDVVLDAHSHHYLPDTLIYNGAGHPVLMSSTSTKFQGVGVLTLSPEGTFSTRIEPLENVAPDATIQAFVDEIKTKSENEGNIMIGHSEVSLPTHTPTGIRMVRTQETAIGNFCADAFRIVLDTDIAFINGGGIRDSICQGEVTFNDLKSVFPFGNTASIGNITGRQLLDVLEFSVSQLPIASGEFMHVSGMKFEVDTSIHSPAFTDENGIYAGVDDTDRRVSNVQILNKEGTYEPVDLNRTYTIAGFNYHLLDGGGQGILNGTNIIASDMGQDIEILSIYVQQYLKGKIDRRYANTEGRIHITQ